VITIVVQTHRFYVGQSTLQLLWQLWQDNLAAFVNSQVPSNSHANCTSLYKKILRLKSVPLPRQGFWGFSIPKQSSKSPQMELWSTINRWSFYHISECKSSLNKRKAPYWKLFGDGSGWNALSSSQYPILCLLEMLCSCGLLKVMM